jgi:hypothetical protein
MPYRGSLIQLIDGIWTGKSEVVRRISGNIKRVVLFKPALSEDSRFTILLLIGKGELTTLHPISQYSQARTTGYVLQVACRKGSTLQVKATSREVLWLSLPDFPTLSEPSSFMNWIVRSCVLHSCVAFIFVCS